MVGADLDARVLVCDPHNEILTGLVQTVHKRFGEGECPDEHYINGLRSAGTFNHAGFSFNLVDTVAAAAEEIRRIPSRDPPHYSLVVYEGEQAVNEIGSAGKMSKINKHDPFLPQIVFGREIPLLRGSEFTRAVQGSMYLAETSGELYHNFCNIFRESLLIPNTTVIKIGGSADDYDKEVLDKRNYGNVCRVLMDIHMDNKISLEGKWIEVGKRRRRGALDREPRRRLMIDPAQPVNNSIVTAGAGQRGNNAKERRAKYLDNPMIQDEFGKRMAVALQENLYEIHSLFWDPNIGKPRSSLLNTGAFYTIDEPMMFRNIPLIGVAPHYILARDRIPLEDSDTHTIALAEFFGAERVVLIKRTDGIYDFDPYRGFPLGLKATEAQLKDPSIIKAWIEAQKNNKRHDIVYVDDMLGKSFSREGTGIDGRADGSSGHLIEDSALRYFANCKHVKEIVVVHLTPEEMHYSIGNNQYKHVVTGETTSIDPITGWYGVLERNIRNAFKGIANSKIVRR